MSSTTSAVALLTFSCHVSIERYVLPATRLLQRDSLRRRSANTYPGDIISCKTHTWRRGKIRSAQGVSPS